MQTAIFCYQRPRCRGPPISNRTLSTSKIRLEEKQMSENKQFFIRVRGRSVPVTEELYLKYYRSKRRDRYYEHDIKIERAVYDRDGKITGYRPAKEDSLDRLMEAGEDFAEDCESVEDAILRAIMVEALHCALDQLPEDERALIDALFFSNGGEGMTEREYAAQFGVSKTALHSHKMKVLAKLRGLLENNF